MKVLSKREIESILPHREPMLLVDEIVTLDSHNVIGSYHMTGDEYFFKGHFPGNPVVPGVIISEIMAQVSCGLFTDSLAGKIPYLTSTNIRFTRVVKSKETLRVEIKLLLANTIFKKVSCKAFCNENLCAEGELTFVVK